MLLYCAKALQYSRDYKAKYDYFKSKLRKPVSCERQKQKSVMM